MFKFDKKQEVFEIGGVKFGGQPGEYPTVLVSTMFYARHKIVTDEDKGIFDRAAAENLWNTQVSLSDETGLPYVNQIVGETPESIKRYIDWFVEIDDRTPFLIDSSAGNVRAAAAQYCTEIGVALNKPTCSAGWYLARINITMKFREILRILKASNGIEKLRRSFATVQSNTNSRRR